MTAVRLPHPHRIESAAAARAAAASEASSAQWRDARQIRHLLPLAYVRALLAEGASPAEMEAAVIVLEDEGCQYLADLTPGDLVTVLQHWDREVRQRALLLAGTIGQTREPRP